MAALCDRLVSVTGDPGMVAVAIKVPHGPVVDALLDRGLAVHAINLKQLGRLRDRFSVAGAKDDRRDARVAAAGPAMPLSSHRCPASARAHLPPCLPKPAAHSHAETTRLSER